MAVVVYLICFWFAEFSCFDNYKLQCTCAALCNAGAKFCNGGVWIHSSFGL